MRYWGIRFLADLASKPCFWVAIMTIMTVIVITESGSMSSHQWSIAEAKAKFSEVIDQAESQGPQTITRHGRTAAVIVAAEEWERKTRRIGNLAEFFAASPLRNSGAKIGRLAGRVRKPKL